MKRDELTGNICWEVVHVRLQRKSGYFERNACLVTCFHKFTFQISNSYYTLQKYVLWYRNIFLSFLLFFFFFYSHIKVRILVRQNLADLLHHYEIILFGLTIPMENNACNFRIYYVFINVPRNFCLLFIPIPLIL